MYEKYDATTLGKGGGGGEYEVQVRSSPRRLWRVRFLTLRDFAACVGLCWADGLWVDKWRLAFAA
jgi:hypothetical protein